MKISSWEEYRKKAIVTAIYPIEFRIIYPTLGLIDETNEFYEKVIGGAKKSELIKECGDTLWYTAVLISDLELDISSIFSDAKDIVAQENKPADITEVSVRMINSAATICGLVKKWIRDENCGPMSDNRLTDIEFELCIYMSNMLYACEALGVQWNEVAEVNIEKLYSRKKRGKLTGSGDDR